MFRVTRELRNEVEREVPVMVDNFLMTPTLTRTVKLKVRPESYGWLNAAAVEVNQVFNFSNEASLLAATRTDLKRKWLSGFDLCHLMSGSARYFERIGADTIQRICVEYAQKRSTAKRLRWRVSRGARRSLDLKDIAVTSDGERLEAGRFYARTTSRYRHVNAKYNPAIINTNDTGAMIMAYTPTRGIRPVFTSM
jgi:hypothetical protein